MHLPSERIETMEVKKKTNQRLKKAEELDKKFDRDLKSCMRCKYFWGNSSQCLNSHCIKEKKTLAVTAEINECTDCPYRQSRSYCFPCMKKLLEKKANEKNVDDQNEVYEKETK